MKKLILDAAIDLHSEKGLGFTTIRKISEKIGYSPATIYLYYPTKDAILNAIQKEVFERLLTTLTSIDVYENPVERLKNLGRLYIDFGVKNPEQYDLIFIQHSPMEAVSNSQDMDYFYQTFLIIQNAVNACVTPKMTINHYTYTASLHLWFLLDGLISLYVKNRLRHTFQSEQQTLNYMYLSWDLCIATF
ncbi:TetR/AcrR family transcriptional regulator [Flectobacillus longus]|uniref:TetR/AcrR family transcriptional regulator n=1 Tax=Flectobacillus longus TaxID=2984207 RepID=UPI0024B6A253|nr:TetR/AcrR family transcriptional regulator [Flectobacillus longus]MDI9882629.1 TetR/AcrR family transcriptional regulator [Flectobacillus longus]